MRRRVGNYLDSFVGRQVVVVGDVMVDSYMCGRVERISPEAPIPIVSVSGREYRLGGAANVALNVKALGATPYICSVIGDDNKGEIFRNLLKHNDLSAEGIISVAGRKTTSKTRIMSGSQHLLRVDDEEVMPIGRSCSDQLLSGIRRIAAARRIDLIIFEDYDKGVLSAELISAITSFARSQGILTAVDPKRANFHAYCDVDLFKPNFKEFTEGLNLSVVGDDVSGLRASVRSFLSSSRNRILLLTLSERGVFISDGRSDAHYPAEVRDIADVSGAGDTVIAVAGLLLCSGADIHDIAVIANAAGGLVCEKAGVVPISRQMLRQAFAADTEVGGGHN